MKKVLKPGDVFLFEMDSWFVWVDTCESSSLISEGSLLVFFNELNTGNTKFLEVLTSCNELRTITPKKRQ